MLERHLYLREAMRGYVRGLAKEASGKGTPMACTMIFEFQRRQEGRVVEDESMSGDKYLICPILYPSSRTRKLYFPTGAKWELWKEMQYSKGAARKTSTLLSRPCRCSQGSRVGRQPQRPEQSVKAK
ncbi:hypothetical protein CONLIGDRAFT_444080 [Coniochaeta ligniaria NRRL 30616]|uniref:Glycosyl hydrolase family 31 C-terminal domain-containing protein n=1 Tax=Coniochaeta ligniaria NRRL 30616 TaxID=1408157 RepID=A0A1J7JD80_9PEZI|nr:hypothetical protein CONLIGDRAFT_444080 [Coniochaeta ligniaria NRRL 30616]